MAKYAIYGSDGKDKIQGGFRSKTAAVEFAKKEVGVPWSVRQEGARKSKKDPSWNGETEEQFKQRQADFNKRLEEIQQKQRAELNFRAKHPSPTWDQQDDFDRNWRKWL